MEDTGFAHERTRLAWQRTTLSLVIGVLVVGRINLERSPFAAVAEVLIALPLCLVALTSLRRGRGPTTDGRVFAAFAAIVVVMAAAQAAVVLFG